MICVLRNGETHLERYLEHHLALGVSHIVLLDNCSTDRTVEIARSFDLVSVFRTDLPYHRFENTMKRYLARRFSTRRWNLIVDVDERFDYPGSDRMPISGLIQYLRSHGYTALVAQMLDMFPDTSIGDLASASSESPESTHTCYDLSGIRRTEYVWGSTSNPLIQMHWDGIRHLMFGSELGLTKAPLVYVSPEVDLFTDWHHVRNSRVADISAVLMHYPFAGSFHSKVRDAVETRRYGHFSDTDYANYWRTITRRPEDRFHRPTSRTWRGLEALIEEDFLCTSEQYRLWLKEMAAHQRNYALGEDHSD
jgi:glycosyltransferase involved in cell wall biosynthesis